jgi:zinc transport system permease protein
MEPLLVLPFAFAGPAQWIDQVINAITQTAPPLSYFASPPDVRALLALVLVSLSCGAVGSLVVGGRMAFFSDALAHCAFAGVSIGFLLFGWLLADQDPREFWNWVTPVMITFGLLVGWGIASVRQSTALASDTVIGIFFAGAIGLAAMLRKLMQDRRLFNLEDFLFGSLFQVSSQDLLFLVLLLLLTAGVLVAIYNQLLLASVNASLALSRRVPTKTVQLVFVLLLAVIVNLCLRYVGALLINALLVVPAATAMNVSRNLRQLFWRTIVLCLLVSLGGLLLSWEVNARARLRLDAPGTVVLLAVALFIVSAVLGARKASGGRQPPVPDSNRGLPHTPARPSTGG